MKQVFLFLIILMMGSLFSCKRVLLIVYDIHKPKQKSKEYLVKYFKRKGLRTDNLIFVNNKKDWLKLNRLSGVDLNCFNKNQEFFWYRDSTKCNAPGFDYSERICVESIPEDRINPNFKLDSILSLTDCFDGSKPKIDSSDFYVVLTCARFCGRLNKDHIKIWEENLMKSSCRVKVYKLCLDPLKDWKNFDCKFNKIGF